MISFRLPLSVSHVRVLFLPLFHPSPHFVHVFSIFSCLICFSRSFFLLVPSVQVGMVKNELHSFVRKSIYHSKASVRIVHSNEREFGFGSESANICKKSDLCPYQWIHFRLFLKCGSKQTGGKNWKK